VENLEGEKNNLVVTNLSLPIAKVHKALPNRPSMERSEADVFLAGSKIPLRLGTVDSKGDPMIHSVWFHYLEQQTLHHERQGQQKGSEY